MHFHSLSFRNSPYYLFISKKPCGSIRLPPVASSSACFWPQDEDGRAPPAESARTGEEGAAGGGGGGDRHGGGHEGGGSSGGSGDACSHFYTRGQWSEGKICSIK